MLDHDGLHALLAIRAGKSGVMRINQTTLANELSTTRLVIHRVLRRMQSDGRLEQLPGAGGPSTRRYRITPPAEWRAQHELT